MKTFTIGNTSINCKYIVSITKDIHGRGYPLTVRDVLGNQYTVIYNTKAERDSAYANIIESL